MKRGFEAPGLTYRVLRPEECRFVNPRAMNVEQLAEYHAALATKETWEAYCNKLGVSIHSERPTQPWDEPK